MKIKPQEVCYFFSTKYIDYMVNKKRRKSYYEKHLGTYLFTRKDILVIEKIMKKYARFNDAKHLRQMPESDDKRRIMSQTRKFTDIHVKAGKSPSALPIFEWLLAKAGLLTAQKTIDVDSIKFLQKGIKSTRYLIVECHPGIRVTITPLRTSIGAQHQYVTGFELHSMNKVIEELTSFIASRQKNKHLNLVVIRK